MFSKYHVSCAAQYNENIMVANTFIGREYEQHIITSYLESGKAELLAV